MIMLRKGLFISLLVVAITAMSFTAFAYTGHLYRLEAHGQVDIGQLWVGNGSKAALATTWLENLYAWCGGEVYHHGKVNVYGSINVMNGSDLAMSTLGIKNSWVSRVYANTNTEIYGNTYVMNGSTARFSTAEIENFSGRDVYLDLNTRIRGGAFIGCYSQAYVASVIVK
jgi:hypothetical protein